MIVQCRDWYFYKVTLVSSCNKMISLSIFVKPFGYPFGHWKKKFGEATKRNG